MHVHLILGGNAKIPDGFKRPYLNFQQYLPEGHYIWPDIEALRAMFNNLKLSDEARDSLGREIDQWMDSHLRGTNPNAARLWVKPGAKAYMIPQEDNDSSTPVDQPRGRPLPARIK